MKRNRSKATAKKRPLWQCALLALPATALFSLLLLFAGSALLLATDDPIRYAGGMGLALFYLTAFIGGILVAVIDGKRSALLAGAMTGALLFALATLPSLIKGGTSDLFGGAAPLLRLPALVFCIAGAFLVCKKKKRRPHRR